MKKFFLALMVPSLMLFGFSLAAGAAEFGVSQNAVYGGIGVADGGIALGADYENLGFRDYGIGGYVRMYGKDDSRNEPGVVAFGAFVRPHFSKKSWDFYVSPGLGIIMVDSPYTAAGAAEDTTTLGPSLAVGLMYELTNSISVGVENMKSWVWFETDWRGLVVDDFMLRFKFAF
jgi:hypothetical protein